jgi:hypothetical protein
LVVALVVAQRVLADSSEALVVVKSQYAAHLREVVFVTVAQLSVSLALNLVKFFVVLVRSFAQYIRALRVR